jgi:hypothetical protein
MTVYYKIKKSHEARDYLSKIIISKEVLVNKTEKNEKITHSLFFIEMTN